MNINPSNPKSWNRGERLRVAQELKISHSAIYQWEKVPVLRVPAVSKITGFKNHELRPDFFKVTP